MLKIIRKILVKLIADIDSGNSKLKEEDVIMLITMLNNLTYKDTRLSKYSACQFLNVSRATFDNYVREGKLPKGKHDQGFNELSWSQKELEEYLQTRKKKKLE